MEARVLKINALNLAFTQSDVGEPLVVLKREVK